MSRGIIILLVFIVLVGLFGLYAIEQGGALFLRPPSQNHIAFVCNRGGNADIWTMSPDGSGSKQITKDAADDRMPTWSHDSREIAYVSDRLKKNYQIFVSAWNGRYTDGLTYSTGTKDMPFWSSDDKSLTYISSGKVYMIKRHGGDEEQYLPPATDTGAGMAGQGSSAISYADWSADQQALLFVQDTDSGKAVYFIEESPDTIIDKINRDMEIKPIGITIARIVDVAWSPSERKVAVAYSSDDKMNNSLFIEDTERLELTRLLSTKGDSQTAVKPAWSADGKKLAFEMWQIKSGLPYKCLGIYVVNASGGTPAPVMKGDVRQPTWSPDGKQIACTVVEKGGKRDIWRVNADGSYPTNLTKGKGDNYDPAWSHKK